MGRANMSAFLSTRNTVLALGLIIALGGISSAIAAPDSLFGDFGDTVKMYRMRPAADGVDRIAEVDAPAPIINSDGTVTLFGTKATRATMIYMPDGHNVAYHVWAHTTYLIMLQGTLNLETGDGKTYPIPPGGQLTGEDWGGKGHGAHCVAKEAKKVCLFLSIDLGETDHSLPPE
jgi:hypothetical protein